MTIKDIAQLAGVSISTVSNIVNGKSAHIRPETRERVLKIVRENNYTPYSGRLNQAGGKSFQLGVLANAHDPNVMEIIKGISAQAAMESYGTLVYINHDAEEEYESMCRLLSQRADGVIWHQPLHAEPQVRVEGIPCVFVNSWGRWQGKSVSIDYSALGYTAATALTEHKHSKITCIASSDSPQLHQFYGGVKLALGEGGIAHADAPQMLTDDWFTHFPRDATAFICFDAHAASQLCKAAKKGQYCIPQDLSVVAILGAAEEAYQLPQLSILRIPFAGLGRNACSALVGQMENRGPIVADKLVVPLESAASIDVPPALRKKKIVVVGPLCMDTVMEGAPFPAMGGTSSVLSSCGMPGGRGVYHAVAAAELGEEVFVMGCVGKDSPGTAILQELISHGINISGIRTDPDADTGRSHVYTREHGEVTRIYHAGANDRLTAADIENRSRVFVNTGCCILHTELPEAAVVAAAKLAKSNGALVIVRHASVSRVSDLLIKHTDILVVNQKELDHLLTGSLSTEKKALAFVHRGVKAVIVTLGPKGCYLYTATESRHIRRSGENPAAAALPSDVTAAVLSVYLSRGLSLLQALYRGMSATGRPAGDWGPAGAPSASSDSCPTGRLSEWAHPEVE